MVGIAVTELEPPAACGRRRPHWRHLDKTKVGRQKSYLYLYWVASERAFFRKATSDDTFSMDVSRICHPDPLSEAFGF